MSFIKYSPFYFNFYQKMVIPEEVDVLSFNHNGLSFYKKNKFSKTKKRQLYHIGLFPSHFKMEIVDKENFQVRIIKERNIEGCAITLDEYKNIDEYLMDHFKSKGNFRNKLRKNLKRLGISFKIEYKMYHGSIAREEYDSLMNTLKEMIASRFNQINKTSFALLKWEETYNRCFEMINKKEASLFVIYNNNVPINISLNYHYNGILFGSIASFDLNYSKFALGHIQIYKLLEWCFSNSYKMLDMCHGNLDYKVMWCNILYHFENHVFYRKSSIFSYLIFQSIVFKLQIKQYLKYLKLNILIEKLSIVWKTRNRDKSIKLELLNYKIEELVSLENIENLKLLETEYVQDALSKLLKPLYTFLYLNEENINQVKLYKQENNDAVYYIQGHKKIVAINFI